MEKELNIIQIEIFYMMVNLKEKENIYGKIINIIQVNLKIIYQMEKELIIIQMEILNMMVNLLMVKEKEKENIFMKIVNIIQENLKIT